MAKRQKDLADWKIVLDDPAPSEPSTPSRRSRRGAQLAQSLSVKLERESDDTRLQAGDCVLLNGKLKLSKCLGDSHIAVILNIELGIKNFVDIQALPFMKVSDVDDDDLPKDTSKSVNELLLTSEVEFFKLADFVQKVQVLSAEEFAEVPVDVSSASTYLCRRATDRFTERFSEIFDYKVWQQLASQNCHQAISFVAEKTLIIVSPKKAKSVLKSLTQRLLGANSPLKKRYIESSDEEDEFSDDSVSEHSVKEEEDDEVEHPEKKKVEVKKKGSRVKKETDKKQNKRTDRASPSPRKQAKIDHESAAYVQKVLSPHKTGYKVKTGASASSLPSLSATSGTLLSAGADTSAEAFKQLKEKLHTSTKVASLPCRENEFTSVYMHLEGAIQNQTGCCIYVSGTPGVGKTATIREVIRELTQISEQGFMNKFDFLEINCLKLIAPNVAYEQLWYHVDKVKLTPSNAALLLEAHFTHEKEGRRPLVVLMDELDQIVTKSQSVMYNFFNWPTYPHSKLIIIAVANTMDLPERVLSNKIASRMGLRRIQFVGYTFQQLGEIIKNRLEMLTEQNRRKVTISEDAVGFASRKVASVSGDARRALAICRRAVEIAEQDYLDSVNADEIPEEEQAFAILIKHISKAINETVNSPIAQLLTSLPFAAKLVLVGVLLRKRRSGLAENSLGDIIDEMRNSLSLLTTRESSSALREISDKLSYMDLLYGSGILEPGAHLNIRIFAMAQIVNELVEQGILIQQNIRSERYRLITLNISEDEVVSALRKDATFAAML